MPQPTRLLIVDDEEMLRELVTAMMEMEGYVVEAAAGGAAALEAITARPPDLMLLDLNMPGMTGWEVIDRMKDCPSPPPVIAMSGMGTEEPSDLVAGRKYVFAYLPKPFTNDQLVKTCTRALATAQAPASVPQTFGEQRARPRRSLLVPATLLSPEGTPAALGQILNLSPDGAQFDLGASLTPGMRVSLAFEIPGGHGPFRVAARIQWKNDGKLGLSFLDVALEDRKRLEELLATS